MSASLIEGNNTRPVINCQAINLRERFSAFSKCVSQGSNQGPHAILRRMRGPGVASLTNVTLMKRQSPGCYRWLLLAI
eukprot:1139735-Pelagomonas_calceolata.AAC.1